MEIRQLQVADAAVYRTFRLRGLLEHPDAFTSSFEEENLKPVADAQRRLTAANDKLWGAFVDGELAGIVGLHREARVKNRHKATLVGMYVAPECTGQGLGRALVDTLLRDARASGIGLVVLTVTDSNLQAAALYARAGFSPFGTEPDAIRVGHSSFGKQHMYLQLTPP